MSGVHRVINRLSLLCIAFTALTGNIDLAKSNMRVCFFGLVPKPDSDQPHGWVAPVIESIRNTCRRGGRTSSQKPGLVTSQPPYGCSADTDGPLGMENGDIPDENINASSIRTRSDAPYFATYARLNTTGYPSCWCAAHDDVTPWIQVAFDRQVYVTGLQIQGDGRLGFWVTLFYVMYSDDGIFWQNVTNKEFTANSDYTSVVSARFDEAAVLFTSFIRLVPIAWFDRCCMRFEVLGCSTTADGPTLAHYTD